MNPVNAEAIALEAKRELSYRAKIELSRRKLHEFVKQAWHILESDQAYVDNWHIQAMCEHLEAVVDGRIENLLINVPPGTMKSLLVCVFWPAWIWIDSPGKRLMFSSYAESLSLRDSDRCRRLLASAWYQSRWPLRFSDSQDAKNKFENEKGGWRMIGSVTGKGTGEHPDLNVVDDPHNVLQAESDAERLTVTNWIEMVYSSRGMVRDVKRVMVMQRLHAQDASGVVLNKGGWTHMCLPMRFELGDKTTNEYGEAESTEDARPRMEQTPIGFEDPRTEEGQLLWPAKYPEEKVAKLENLLGQYNTAGQLQQRPAPRGGGKFKRNWFKIVEALPNTIQKIVRYWDKAGTSGGTGARTAGVLMASFLDLTIKPTRSRYIILDAAGYRFEAPEREAMISQTCSLDSRHGHVETWVEQEPGSGGKESAEGTISNNPGYTVKIERVTGSKEVRCDPFASQASVGNILLLAGPWNKEFLDEITMFPMGRLKDMVDSAGGAFNKLVVPAGSFGSGDAQGASKGGSTMRRFTPRQFTPRRI